MVKWPFIKLSFLYVAILLFFENLFKKLYSSLTRTLGLIKHIYAFEMKVKLDIDMEFSF